MLLVENTHALVAPAYKRIHGYRGDAGNMNDDVRYAILENNPRLYARLSFMGPQCDAALIGVCYQADKAPRAAYEQYLALKNIPHVGTDATWYSDGCTNPPVIVSIMMHVDRGGVRDTLIRDYGKDLDLLPNPSYDSAVLGVCYQPDRPATVAYDEAHIIRLVRIVERMRDHEEAFNFYDQYMLSACAVKGEPPVFIDTLKDDELD